MDPLGESTRRFPLVARPRPACQRLSTRAAEVTRLAHAAQAAAGAASLSLAAEAHNKAALIASDCGLPGLARDLCWRQFRIYQRAAPLEAATAKLALQPVVNVARLAIRDGDGQGAYQLLDTLYQAISRTGTAVVDGQAVSFSDFTRSEDDHREVTQWLWTVLLGDGIRALAQAGHWEKALAHAEKHHGIGTRLLDGRQTAVIAHCTAGDPGTALSILRETTPGTAWEQAVASCLNVICLNATAQPAEAAIAAMAEHYLGSGPVPGLTVFRTRLGLTVLDLANEAGHHRAAEARTRLISETLSASDGYAARDILASQASSARLTGDEQRALSEFVRSAGLGTGTMPPELLAGLLSAAETCEATVEKHARTQKDCTSSQNAADSIRTGPPAVRTDKCRLRLVHRIGRDQQQDR